MSSGGRNHRDGTQRRALRLVLALGLAAGAAPAAGASHGGATSPNYVLAHDTQLPNGQDGWRWCVRCQSLFYGGHSSGRCPAGGAHDRANSYNYVLAHDVAIPDGQNGWRWCQRCQTLFRAGQGAGSCPAGGGHDPGPSWDYVLTRDVPLAGGQDGWRWCSRCAALYYAGAGGGQCPAPAAAGGTVPTTTTGANACGLTLGSGIHAKWTATGGERGLLGCPVTDERDALPSPRGTTGRYAEFRGGDGGFIVWHGSGPLAGRSFEVHGCAFKVYRSLGTASWLGFPVSDERDVPGGRRSDFEGGSIVWEAAGRTCRAYRPGEVPGAAATPAGPGSGPPGEPRPPVAGGTAGGHDRANSFNYVLSHDVAVPGGQGGWRWCRRCESLFYGGHGDGACPAGGAHDRSNSYDYVLPHDAPAPNAQGGWRWCRRCQSLFYGGHGAAPCPAGGSHDATGSYDYVLPHDTTPPNGQDSWRWCARCQSLFYGGHSGGRCLASVPMR